MESSPRSNASATSCTCATCSTGRPRPDSIGRDMLIAIGVLVCAGAWLVGRALARRLLAIPGTRPLSRAADDAYFATPLGRRAAYRAAGPVLTYLVVVF